MIAVLLATAALSTPSGANTMLYSPWKVLPIYGGGFVQNIVIAPTDPSVWYAYVDVGGPYRSDDAGRHWYPLHQNMSIAMRSRNGDFVRTLSIDPRDANSFVIACGNSSTRPMGICVSRDGGLTFRQTLQSKFYGDGVRRSTGAVLARNPAYPDVMICGEDLDGVFLSCDNGETWKTCGLEGTWLTDLVWDENDTDRAFACSPEWIVGGSQVRFTNDRKREVGLWRSDDRGNSWCKIAAESPLELVTARGTKKIVGLFDERTIKTSEDGGCTWSFFEEGLPIEKGTVQPKILTAGHFMALEAGPDFWLVANSKGDVFRRGFEDTGWTLVECESLTLGNPTAETHLRRYSDRCERRATCSLVVAKDSPKHWLSTDWHNIWESEDAGRHWTSRVGGMMQLVPFCVECDPGNAQNICVGTADMGLHVSNDGGKTYAYVPQTGGGSSVAWLKHHNGTAFCVGGKIGIQFIVTRDGGRKWGYVKGKGLPTFRKGLPQPGDFSSYTVACDPTTDDVYLCVAGPTGSCGGGVYRSHDLGETWERFSKGLPVSESLFKRTEFEGGGDAGWTPELVFGMDGSAVLSTFESGLCYYLDRENGTWIKTSLQNKRSRCTIAADPFRPGRFLSAQGEGLYESLDGGRTWSRGNFSANGCGYTVAFDAHVKDLVVSAAEDRVLVSRDGGRHFNVLKDGLLFPSGDKRWVRVDRGRLFALTRGSGVWTRDLMTCCYGGKNYGISY